MFEHTHHQKIFLILNALNSEIFEEVGAYFGGGTLITLLNGEYRWSKDVDFICPVGEGYRRLREIVAKAYFKPAIFFKTTKSLKFPRDVQANQYGVRFLVIAEDTPIKFEIIAEARIKLNPPERLAWIPVPSLNFQDQCTEKLLANADRWGDSSIKSRDLIDLAMLRIKSPIPDEAIKKAEKAYPVIPELTKALNKFQGDYEYRKDCFIALEIKNRSVIINGIDLLAQGLSLEKTKRKTEEI